MIDGQAGTPPQPPPETGGPTTLAGRLAERHRIGGVVTPLVTTVIAFLLGGLVVLASGQDPVQIYRAIFTGTGFGWIFHGGDTAASNLQQTLIFTTTLTLTGLAVAFAFRCGMFNIGGQGQYLVGWYVAIIVGTSWSGLPGPLIIFLAVALSVLAGAFWGGIAGVLKATTGAHEVISTIMLNWIAIWVGDYLFGLSGPFVSGAYNPTSQQLPGKAWLPVWWGDPQLQGLHIGFFISLGALVVFWLLLNRTTLGFEVRAVGYNPEAARYGGVNVQRSYVAALAISGAFAGLAGAIDVLGVQHQVATPDIHNSNVGFLGVAVALLGRNVSIGVFLGALLFGALNVGTAARALTGQKGVNLPPQLLPNLTLIIQGLVVLFVGADLLVISIWESRRKLLRRLRRAGP